MSNIKLLPSKEIQKIEIPHKNKKSQKRKTNISDEIYLESTISWYLTIGINIIIEESDMFFMEIQYSEPSNKLTDEITNETILELLNLNLLFEFEYLPQNGDLFVLRQHYVYENDIKNRNRPYLNNFLSFIFSNQNWKNEYYKSRYDFDKILKGTVIVE